MEQLVYKVADMIENIGMINSLILIIIMFAIFLGVITLFTVIEPYLRVNSLKDTIAYGEYQVVVRKDNGDIKDTVIIRAWNDVNAVEKVAKKLDTVNGFSFVTTKIKKRRLGGTKYEE